jgi:hypothetical protein
MGERSVGMEAYQTWRAHGHPVQVGRQYTAPNGMA